MIQRKKPLVRNRRPIARSALRRKAPEPRSSTAPASSSKRLALAKGRSRAAEKRARRADRSMLIGIVRGEVFRAFACCQLCGEPGHEMHEVLSRARLRGHPPEVVFNRWNCCRLCTGCHVAVTRHRIDILFVDDAQGAAGGIEAQARLPGFGAPLLPLRPAAWAIDEARAWKGDQSDAA